MVGARCDAYERSTVRIVLASLLLALAAPTAAQPVRFDEAIALAARTPAVRGAERALSVRERGDANIAGTAQGLSLQAMPGYRILNEQDRGFEGQLSAVHTWNLGDLTGARRRAAHAERRELAAEVRARALLAHLDAAHRWVILWQLHALEPLLAEEVALAERLVELVERGLRAGVRTRVDTAEAIAYQADVALRALTLEGTRHAAAAALAVAMGREPDADLRTEGDPPSPDLPDEPSMAADRLPAVAVARLAAAAERAREVETAAAYAPQLGVGAMLQREAPDHFIVFGVATLTLPLFDRGQRARSVALAEAERREGEHEQARLEARRMLAVAAHDVEHARREALRIDEQLVPALAGLVELRERALAAGEGTTFELLDARRRLLGARARAVEARGARAWAEVRLWVLLAEIARSEA